MCLLFNVDTVNSFYGNKYYKRRGKLKNVVYIVMLFIFILAGCSDETNSNELVDYDKESVIYSLNKLEFNPEVPKLLPYEPSKTNVDVHGIGGLENNSITISLVGDNQEKITLHASTLKNTFDFTEEKIKIQENVDGSYGEKDGNRTMKWVKDDVYYELFVNSNSTSKNELLKIAQSFYQIKLN